MPRPFTAFLIAAALVATATPASASAAGTIDLTTAAMISATNTERRFIDALQAQHRNSQTFWATWARFRDQEFRTNERVMTTR